jgi:hypothetical protein
MQLFYIGAVMTSLKSGSSTWYWGDLVAATGVIASFLALLFALVLGASAMASSVAVQPETIVGPKAAHTVLGPIAVVGDPATLGITLTGTDAGRFALSPGSPPWLMIGPQDLPGGTFNFNIVVTGP